ncbi:bifunctional diguanylate cyclase/phosphodiesterase [Lysinibacillus yapensis]|nr:GGDEF domain-containing protein [Lysinibacillus yapensis]
MVSKDKEIVEKNVLELVWNNTNDAIFTIGYDGRVLSLNPAFSSMLGWDKKDLTDVNCFPFFVQPNKEEHEHQLNLFRQGIDIPYHVTKRKRKDGKELDILASYRAVKEGNVLAVGMYKDFTEQMKIQRQLKASQECYRNLVQTIPDAIFVENDGKIVFVNQPGVKMIGAEDSKQLMGQSVWQFILTENDKQLKKNIHNAIETGEPLLVEMQRLNGEMLWVELVAMSIYYEGESVLQVVMRDVTAKKSYEEQLEFLAFHDPLTGVTNRRYFTDYLNKAIEREKSKNGTLALLYLDLDKFKEINDTKGHDVGDELLKQFANRLSKNIREMDIVCRVGGDEFLILIDGVESEQIIREIIKRLHEKLMVPYSINGLKISVYASIGVARFPADGQDSKILISKADKALYQAKQKCNTYIMD